MGRIILSAPAEYTVQLTKRNDGKLVLKVGTRGNPMIRVDLKTLQEVTQVARLLLDAEPLAGKSKRMRSGGKAQLSAKKIDARGGLRTDSGGHVSGAELRGGPVAPVSGNAAVLTGPIRDLAERLRAFRQAERASWKIPDPEPMTHLSKRQDEDRDATLSNSDVHADRPVFTVHEFETGKTYRIYTNGRTEGFADASSIHNNILLLVHTVQDLAIKARDGGVITDEQTASILDTWHLAPLS